MILYGIIPREERKFKMIEELVTLFQEAPRLVIGNAIGIVSIVFAFLSYQAKTAKKLLLLQTGLVLSVVVSYAVLGAWSGMALNVVCLIRNISYTVDRVRLFHTKVWPWILAVAMGCMGAFSWQGPVSLLVIAALMINTVFLSLNDNNKLRASLLFTCTLVILYDLFVQAYLPIVMEAVSMVSAAIGLIRFRNCKNTLGEQNS